MANITPRVNKNGEITSYTIRVHRGRDASGKRLKDYSMSWKPAQGMTKRQIEKELTRQAALFEENCRLGNVSTEKHTFEKYADYVVSLKERNGAKAKTIASYREMLVRINAHIGSIKLADLRVDHLNRLYTELSKSGQRLSETKATPKFDMKKYLKANNLSNQKFAERAHVAASSVSAVVNKRTVSDKTADRIAAAMGKNTKDLFKLEKSDKPLSPTTIIRYHRVISTILSQAVKEGLIPYNPATRATLPKMPKKEVKALEVEQMQEILTALESEPLKWKVCIYLMIETGARRGEIMGLRWECVNWKENTLLLRENRVSVSGKGIVSTTLKTGESRTVTVSQGMMDMLNQWRFEQMSGFIRLGATPSGYIMTTDYGEPMHPDSPARWLTRFSQRHNLPPLHPHLFRHTQASLLISEGIDIITVSKRLGHAKTSTTLDIYSHVLEKSDAKAAELISQTLYKKQA